MFKGTTWYLPALAGPVWAKSVKSTVKQFDPKFPASAVATWDAFVKVTGVVLGRFPPSSEWLAPGIP